MTRLKHIIYAIVALILAFIVVRYFNERPSYTDAFYHYNAAVRLAEGDGLTDDYLWVFIAAPDELPAPSHLYWMPLTSIVSAIGMRIVSLSYLGAQIGLTLALWGAVLITYWLALHLAKRIIWGWAASIILLFGGFLVRMWGVTDTFAVYAFVGSATLACMGLGLTASRQQWRWWLMAGIFAALSHLTRSDGLIMAIVATVAILWPMDIIRKRSVMPQRLCWLGVFIVAYVLVMMPLFIRNLNAIGTPLPVGGTQAIWYTEYNDLFNYPQDANPQTFFADGVNLLIESRIEGISSAIQNLLAIEGYIILLPFMLLGLWFRRSDPFLRPMWLFALGIHVAFALVFTWPGIRGGLFHALTALMPFWCVLAFIGLEATIERVAKRLEHWNAERAQVVFAWLLVGIVVILGMTLAIPRRVVENNTVPAIYEILQDVLPSESRVMINDPSQLYYYTGMGGVTLPNEAPETMLELAEEYDIDFLVMEFRDRESGRLIFAPADFQFDLDSPPSYLQPLEADINGAMIYAIHQSLP